MTTAARTSRWGWWYVAEHRIANIRSYWITLLVTSFGSPFIYVLGLGLGLGIMVDRGQGGQGIDGIPYLTFVAPALLLSAVMQGSSSENVYGTYGGFKWTHWFDTQYATPITPRQMVVGSQVGVLIRTTITAVCYALVIAVVGIAPLWRALLVVPVAMLLSLAMGFVVMAWAARQTDDRAQLNFVERFVVTPLALFSGTYFPLEVLPGYLHPIGWISPLWHAVDLGRWALYGHAVPGWLVLVHVAFLSALAAVGAWSSMRTFVRRLDQ